MTTINLNRTEDAFYVCFEIKDSATNVSLACEHAICKNPGAVAVFFAYYSEKYKHLQSRSGVYILSKQK